MPDLINSIPLSLNSVKINDSFWSQYLRLVREVVIPYQWEALNDRVADAAPSHAIKNFKIAAGLEQGEFYGCVFQDSDVAKWLEAVGYSLQTHPDSALESIADETIDIIEKAQQADGYLNTHFIIKAPDKRWTNLKDWHELYCAGHMMEAAVSYYQATGKRKLLDVMCRYADYIDSVFGPEPEKLHGYPGHQEVELALVKLYKVTGQDKYLKLAKYFIDQRGTEPHYFEAELQKRKLDPGNNVPANAKINKQYHQAHLPVREQSEAVGHAVRAVYMYTGMADIARESGDSSLLEACKKLWNNITTKQMYITGGIGSTNHGEAFTFDYDLPNDIVYAETCASIGLIYFAFRMLQMEMKSCYVDVIERALYNTVTSSMSRDGRQFFYVNPLEVWPAASAKNPTRAHVKPVRQKWFGCACCPPNVARMLASLGQYIYTVDKDSVYTHLYIGGETILDVGGSKIAINQDTNYPWDGKVTLKVSTAAEKEFNLGLRMPGWCRKAALKVNDEQTDINTLLKDGYIILNRMWRDGDTVEFDMNMPVELIQSNPQVRANAGKVAIQRGPLVYCLEEMDNGSNLSALSISLNSELTTEFDNELPGGAIVIKGNGTRIDESSWDGSLYSPVCAKEKPMRIKAVPYYLWGNRNPGEMMVWIRQK